MGGLTTERERETSLCCYFPLFSLCVYTTAPAEVTVKWLLPDSGTLQSTGLLRPRRNLPPRSQHLRPGVLQKPPSDQFRAIDSLTCFHKTLQIQLHRLPKKKKRKNKGNKISNVTSAPVVCAPLTAVSFTQCRASSRKRL